MIEFELHQDQELASQINGLAITAWLYLILANSCLYVKLEWLFELGY